MKSVVLMFIGGLVGGMIGPVAALVGAAGGFLIGSLSWASIDTPSQQHDPE